MVHSLGCQEYLEYFGKRIFCKSVIFLWAGVVQKLGYPGYLEYFSFRIFCNSVTFWWPGWCSRGSRAVDRLLQQTNGPGNCKLGEIDQD